MGPGGASPWRVDEKSIAVVNDSRYQTNRFHSPARFDEYNPVGVSDHYPIMGRIVRRQATTAAR
jgi:hypothetical protein